MVTDGNSAEPLPQSLYNEWLIVYHARTMIPLKLSLRNFMCYRENVAPLDFSGIHLACLSGDNGHGKSALLDAMTWALWGRSWAKTDDELIFTGATDMEVAFDFRAGRQHLSCHPQATAPQG